MGLFCRPFELFRLYSRALIGRVCCIGFAEWLEFLGDRCKDAESSSPYSSVPILCWTYESPPGEITIYAIFSLILITDSVILFNSVLCW